ncbi:FixH family protein [Kiloniella sp. b19]|uniref:FixH family protein n=1 Tax=Kiloniella sp. GXU_MW_B19 TaxID=3141326 RepID=UPI0031DDCCD3
MASNQNSAQQDGQDLGQKGSREKQLTGKMVLAMFVGFFMTVFVANGIFLYFANKTWTGLSTENAYDRGLNYNEVIEREEAQKELGWSSSVEFLPARDSLSLQVVFLDRNSNPVQGLEVSAKIQRPSLDRYDQTIRLLEVNSGEYSSPVRVDLDGQWQVDVTAVRPDGFEYLLRERLFLQRENNQ